MKKAQKILIMLTICSLSMLVVGCSSDENKKTTTETEENKSKKLSNEEIFNKINDATKEIKSLREKIDYSEVMTGDGKKTETLVNTEVITSDNPTVTKMESTITSLGKKSSIYAYFTEGRVYAKDEKTNEWLNIKEEETKKSLESEKEFTKSNGILEIMNSVKDKLKIKEKKSEYEISYSGADASVEDYLKKVTFMSEDVSEKLLELVDIEKIEIIYKADKSTFMPKEYTIQIKLKVQESKAKDYFQIKLKSAYSDINKVDSITIPDEVKNAKEYTGN